MFEKINKEILEQTIDLKGVGEGNKTFFSKDDSLPEIQKQGVFSLCKILSKPEQKFAYLADEVGLGKTYQAMGVISMLLRERENKEKPRILIIAPNTTVQKNWERELYLFSENNLVNREKRLFSRDDVKNFGNKNHALKKENSYRERLELRNAIESKKGIYWKTINIVKMTSFGSYAELLGISHIKEKGKVKYNLEKLLGALHQSIPENLEEKNVETEKAGIICGSYYNRKKPPKFDLIIIDEAQNLRNRNNQTTFLNSWLGLYRWADQPEIINCGTPHLLKDQDTKYLLLSATPTHRSKQTLSNVLEFFVSDKKKLENLQHDDIKNFLIRRLRTYEGKETKYDVRKQEGKDVFDNNNNLSELLEQKLMIALVQSRLAQFEGGKSNSTFKTGFLECFESFTPSEDTEVETAEDDPTGDPVEKKKGPFHEEKGNAPDKIVMAEIAENYENIMGKKPPHPKFNQTEKEICDLLNSENPEKCVIFVRRLASVRELQRRIIDIYEENIFDYWASRIIPRNCESERKK